MRHLVTASLLVLACCNPARPERPIREIAWRQAARPSGIPSGFAQAAPLNPAHPVQQLGAEVPEAWWSDRQAGLFGGIAGTVFGCLGGLIGTLAGLGKARPLVVALMVAMLVAGILNLVAGIVALSLGQPYAVYYPLLLLGAISTLVIGPLLPTIRRRYAEIELRKMSALDAGGEQLPRR